MDKRRVAVTLTSFADDDPVLLELLNQRGFVVFRNTLGRRLNRKETLKLCAGCSGIIAGTEIYDRDILKKLSQVKVISRCGVGMDNIDCRAAMDIGIKLFNTPEVPIVSVAELTVGLILSLLRKINKMHNAIIHKRWEKTMGNLLYAKKVGIIGFGRVGRRVARILKSFGCEIAYTDPFVTDRLMGFKRLPLQTLLVWADIVSLHVSGSNKILGEKQLWKMKRGAWLINVSRGGLIDEAILYQMLKEGRLSGAAIDVFQREPYAGPLIKLNNVILTPHIGSYAKEARVKMEQQAVKNLLKGFRE